MSRCFPAVASASLAILLSACSGPTRTYGPPPKESVAVPERLIVAYAVASPSLFAPQVTNALAACGVRATTLDLRGKAPEVAKAEAHALADSSKAEYALEVTLSTLSRDQHGPRANSYDVRLTRLADRKEVWRANTSVYLRRIGAAGTDKDLADGVVAAMAEAKILRDCPARSEEK